MTENIKINKTKILNLGGHRPRKMTVNFCLKEANMAADR